MENIAIDPNQEKLLNLKKTFEKITDTYAPQDKEAKQKLVQESYEVLKTRLTSEEHQMTQDREAILKIKLARYFQNHEVLDTQSLGDAILETPKFIDNEKGSFDRLLEIHEQKTLQRIAEARKRRADIGDQSISNPYENLFSTKSGNYYMARLLNMPHLETESEYMKHCVGTSDSYINRMKRGEIEIFSFREINKRDGVTTRGEDTPILTIEYNLKTKEIVQIKKMGNGLLSESDPYFFDVIDALGKLKQTETDSGQKRDFVKINDRDLSGIHLKTRHILTNRGIFDIRKYQAEPDDYIIKTGPLYISESTSRREAEKILALGEHIVVDLTEIALRPDQITQNTKVYIGEIPKGFFKNIPPSLEHIYTTYPNRKIDFIKIQTENSSVQLNKKTFTEKSVDVDLTINASALLEDKNVKINLGKTPKTLVKISCSELGLEGEPTIDQVYKRAQELGLSLCTPETALEIALDYSEMLTDYQIWNIATAPVVGVSTELPVMKITKNPYDGVALDAILDPTRSWKHQSMIFQVT